jgi:hypothetical protein
MIMKNVAKSTTIFDDHAVRGIWRDAHRPMERIFGFMQSH